MKNAKNKENSKIKNRYTEREGCKKRKGKREMRPSRKQNKRTTNKIKKLVCKNRNNNTHTMLGNILDEIQALKLEVMRSAKGTNKAYRALIQQQRHLNKLAAKVEIKEKRNQNIRGLRLTKGWVGRKSPHMRKWKEQ